MATNRFVCEICNKGFQRDQNLQLHRRGHNLPWKLKQRSSTEIRKRVYICPEPTCVHHNPARALGDLTGIKKHFCRKHGEKKWKCDKCSKKYAVQSDWKAHSKTCGTREYKCDCGTIFSRRDSFITHRAFCDALAEENNKVNQGLMATMEAGKLQGQVVELMSSMPVNNTSPGGEFSETDAKNPLKSLPQDLMVMPLKPLTMTGGMFSSSSGTLFNGPRSNISSASSCLQLSANSLSNFDGLDDGKIGRQLAGSAHMSATALLQKAAQMGATASSNINSPMMQKSFVSGMAGLDQFNGIRSSSPYGGINQQDNNNNNNNNSSLDYMQSQTDQSQVDGMINNGGGFINQFLHKGLSSQEMSSQFIDPTTPGTTDSSSSGMNNMAMFTGLFMGGDQQHGFLKNMEQHDHQNSSSTTASMSSPGRTTVNSSGLGIAGCGRSPIGLSRFGENNNGDMMTVDFLGVGGISRSANLNEQQQQQQRMDQLEAISQQRLHSFQVQELLNSQAMDKPMWDV
ncbi:zinc finger protein [Macleaya cordata]|uniref:Zinc finger protein n=1 Tax=Macleaya cordata TaxID=56857 RepID=A0A200PYY1_MACCD|nr:zinc finger protein [Macleaya cordata]